MVLTLNIHVRMDTTHHNLQQHDIFEIFNEKREMFIEVLRYLVFEYFDIVNS